MQQQAGNAAGEPQGARHCEATLETIFTNHYGAIYRFLLRQTRNREDAEDLAQDVFVDAALHLHDVAPSGPLPWLYTVARRRSIDAARRARVAESAMIRAVGVAQTAPDVADRAGISEALAKAIYCLPQRPRVLVVLHVLEGLSFPEISDIVGVSQHACKMSVSRALRSVRTDLQARGFASTEPVREPLSAQIAA